MMLELLFRGGGAVTVESMFDLVENALGSRGVAAVGAWAQVENAACARRLFACAQELDRMLAADGSDNREQWCLDNWSAVAASIAAAQNVSLGVASHQLLIADALRHRLPRVAEVFAAGAITYRLIGAIVARTRLIRDRDALAKVDTEIAARVQQWGVLSAHKTEMQIDYWVDRYDPAAVRRTEYRAQGLGVDIHDPEDGSGVAFIDGRLIVTDAEALDRRLDAIARTVCDKDPRTHAQRRSAALGALGHQADRLVCGCDNPDCDAKERTASAVVVHVIAGEESLSDDTCAQLDGQSPPLFDKPLSQVTWGEALTPEPPRPMGRRRLRRQRCSVARCCPPRCWPPRSPAPPRSCPSSIPAMRSPSRATFPRRCWPRSCGAAT
jgi:hypothetical protein